MIGVYTRTLADTVRTEMVNSLMHELSFAHYKPVLGLGRDYAGPWFDSPWMNAFRELNTEALVVLSQFDEKIPDTFDIPAILVGTPPRPNSKCDQVALDRKDAFTQIASHFKTQGHKTMLFARGENSVWNWHHMVDPVAKSLDIDIQMLPKDYRDDDIENALAQVDEFIASNSDITAIHFHNSTLAAHFIGRCGKFGLRVPQDIAVTGYNYFPMADVTRVPLTTIEQPITSLIWCAIKAVKDRLKDPKTPPVNITLPHNLVVRESSKFQRK